MTVKTQQLAPNFILSATNGRLVELWDYRQKKNLVLIFLRTSNQPLTPFLSPFIKNYPEYQNENAELICVCFGGKSKGLDPGIAFPILNDADGSAADAYLKSNSNFGIFVLDRYGELWRQWQGRQISETPAQAEILDELSFIERQCPE